MNSVKISGLVLMGAFTLGITSGSVVQQPVQPFDSKVVRFAGE